MLPGPVKLTDEGFGTESVVDHWHLLLALAERRFHRAILFTRLSRKNAGSRDSWNEPAAASLSGWRGARVTSMHSSWVMIGRVSECSRTRVGDTRRTRG